MSDQRIIIAMGMGVHPGGADHTKAAVRAVEDAMRHSDLPILRTPDLSAAPSRLVVTIGVPQPDAVDKEAITALFDQPIALNLRPGGLTVRSGSTVASAALELFLPKQAGWQLRT